MGYNISEVSGNATGGSDIWGLTLDLTDPSATTVSGDFDVVPLFGGGSSEATSGYSFSALSTTAYGSLSYNTTNATYTFTVDRSAVIASGSDQVVSFTVTGTSGSRSDTDTVNITILICVNRGTLVATPDGPQPVENLHVGNLVDTLDGPAKQIRWIGSRKLSHPELDANPSLKPIRISADAFGAGRPTRDLVVSPQHRIYLDDWRASILFGEDQVLAPAKGLINDHTVCVDHTADEVEYFHLLFDGHEIIFTEGAPTESFHPGEYTLREMDAGVRNELFKLFPDLRETAGRSPAARASLYVWEAAILAAAG